MWLHSISFTTLSNIVSIFLWSIYVICLLPNVMWFTSYNTHSTHTLPFYKFDIWSYSKSYSTHTDSIWCANCVHCIYMVVTVLCVMYNFTHTHTHTHIQKHTRTHRHTHLSSSRPMPHTLMRLMGCMVVGVVDSGSTHCISMPCIARRRGWPCGQDRREMVKSGMRSRQHVRVCGQTVQTCTKAGPITPNVTTLYVNIYCHAAKHVIDERN